MKTAVPAKTLLALILAIVTVGICPAPAQPAPDSSAASPMPADITPGTPLAEVVKLVQAGVDAATIQSYIANAQSPFNLDADKIIFLKDEGVPSALINAMMERDKELYAANAAPPPAPVAGTPEADAGDTGDTADTTPPPADVTVNYFYDTLSPYGSWVNIGGYGQCWRPTTVIYDPSWRPYCDRGQWVYTDYGWYWNSDYSWGITFHYGRWFRSPQFGWCWYPDTVWAPSWVTWRSDNDYCGWAPLPPFAVFTPGVGFYYRGVNVGLNFDFGLDAACFTFVSPAHFCDRHPRAFCAPAQVVPQIFRQTVVINNFDLHSRTLANHGIPAERIAGITHRSIEPVQVSALPNAGRQGWRGAGWRENFQRTARPAPVNNNNSTRTAPGGSASTRPNYGQAVSGSTAGGHPMDSNYSPGQNRPAPAGQGQSQPDIYRQTQPQPSVRQYNNTYTAPSQPAFQNESPARRTYETPSSGGLPQHGDEPLQHRQYVAPYQPQEEPRQNNPEPPARNYNQPSPQPAAGGESHNNNTGSTGSENRSSGGGSSGGSNNGADNGNNRNSNR